MKKTLLLALCAVGSLSVLSEVALAGSIKTACLRSDRDGATRAVCTCIQQVADMTLKASDQSRAAKFFGNPDLAHKTWISQKPGDDAFWDRYKEFGAQAEAYCAG